VKPEAEARKGRKVGYCGPASGQRCSEASRFVAGRQPCCHLATLRTPPADGSRPSANAENRAQGRVVPPKTPATGSDELDLPQPLVHSHDAGNRTLLEKAKPQRKHNVRATFLVGRTISHAPSCVPFPEWRAGRRPSSRARLRSGSCAARKSASGRPPGTGPRTPAG